MSMLSSNDYSKYDFSSLKKETCFVIDSNGCIEYVEAKISGILGYSAMELTGNNFREYLFDYNSHGKLPYIIYSSKSLNINLRHKDGHPINVYINLEYSINSEGKINRIFGTLIALPKSKYINPEYTTISKIIDNSKDVLYRYSLSENKIIYLSKSVNKLTGYSAEEILKDKKLLIKRIHPEDLNKYHMKVYSNMDFSKPLVTRVRHKDGHYIWVEDCMTPFLAVDGSLLFIDGACRDISVKIEKDNKLKYLTYHDALSGLYNRNYFEEKLRALDKDLDIPVAIILCDLDNLKIVNDTLGHDKGDQMIAHVGKLLSSIADLNSFAARIGGDEFVVVVKNTSLFTLKQTVINLIDMVEDYNKLLGEYTINMSIGTAYNDHSNGNMQKLFKIADNQMYLNKSIRKAL